MLAQLGCYPREERKPIESADGTTSAAGERRPTGKSIQESELGLERFLSRWLRMYTGVQGILRSGARDAHANRASSFAA